jgi:hypothetical protein
MDARGLRDSHTGTFNPLSTHSDLRPLLAPLPPSRSAGLTVFLSAVSFITPPPGNRPDAGPLWTMR